MRDVCKTDGCTSPLEPSKHSGARHVYCVQCDRETARERMRERRALQLAKQATQAYYRPKQGYVYVISNPVFFGWYKVGCALNAKDRLNTFQTADPFRSFRIEWQQFYKDKLDAESAAHKKLEVKFERRGEWFKGNLDEIMEVLNG